MLARQPAPESSPIDRFFGFFWGGINGIAAWSLNSCYILIMPLSFFALTDKSIVKTALCCFFIYPLVLGAYAVLSTASLVYFILKGMQIGAGRYGGVRAASWLVYNYLGMADEAIQNIETPQASYLLGPGTRLWSGIISYFFLPTTILPMMIAEVNRQAYVLPSDPFPNTVLNNNRLPVRNRFRRDDRFLAYLSFLSQPAPATVGKLPRYEIIQGILESLKDSLPQPESKLSPSHSKKGSIWGAYINSRSPSSSMPLEETKDSIRTAAPAVQKMQSTWARYINSYCLLSNAPIQELKDPLTIEWRDQSVPITVSALQFDVYVARCKARNKPVVLEGKNLNDEGVSMNKGFSDRWKPGTSVSRPLSPS